MKGKKKDLIQFLVWMRNGIAFCTSWFLILWLVYNHSLNIENIATDSLIKMLLSVIGGVFLFTFFFTKLFINKWSFVWRLTGFMVLISIYECVAFYWLGIFAGGGAPGEWLIFIGIVLILYLVCIGIYHIYSQKQGELYTQALQQYQLGRRAQHEK